MSKGEELTSAQRKVMETLYSARSAQPNSNGNFVEIDGNQWRSIRALADHGFVDVVPSKDGHPSLVLTPAGVSLMRRLHLAEARDP